MDASEPAYTRRVSHTFSAGGENWEVTYSTTDWIEFADTRKHHAFGYAELVDGQWRLSSEQDNGSIEEYMGSKTVSAVLAFFNEHGSPDPDAEPTTVAGVAERLARTLGIDLAEAHTYGNAMYDAAGGNESPLDPPPWRVEAD